MRRTGRLYLLTGLLLAFAAVIVAIIALQRQRPPSPAEPTETPTVPVVVAAHDIRAGTVLRQEDVQVVAADPASIAPGTARQVDQVVGLVVAGDLVAGQRILLANLVMPSVANAIQPGKRAVAIPVDRINAVGGLIQQNDVIDLVYAGRLELTRVLPTQPLEMGDSGQGYSPPPEQVTLPVSGTGTSYPYAGAPGSRVVVKDIGEGQLVTKLIVQNLRVLQVIAGSTPVEPGVASPSPIEASRAEATPTPTTTLPAVDLLIVEADPEQAEIIAFLLDQNIRYHVVLRARGDTEQVQTDGVTYDRLVEEDGLPVPAPVVVGGGPR